MNETLHLLCLAPMMDRTDRHFRFLLRLIAPRTFLYTEMITAAAIANGDAGRLLRFDAAEHPVGVQLGGSSPGQLAAAARRAEAAGYDEINLNVGCPSDRVQAGCFGAALMLEPDLVAECVHEMIRHVSIPVTVKTRLGVDHADSYELLAAFTAKVAAAGCGTLIVHARKAWLKGLSPRQNREIPPLDYARVHRLKADFPALEIVLNGGLRSREDVLSNLGSLDGVMLGRAAYDQPMLLSALEAELFGDRDRPTAATEAVLRAYLAYMRSESERGEPLRRMTRHLAGLFSGRPGARAWRRDLGTLEDGRRGLARLSARVDRLLSERNDDEHGDCLHAAADCRYNDAGTATTTAGGEHQWERR